MTFEALTKEQSLNCCGKNSLCFDKDIVRSAVEGLRSTLLSWSEIRMKSKDVDDWRYGDAYRRAANVIDEWFPVFTESNSQPSILNTDTQAKTNGLTFEGITQCGDTGELSNRCKPPIGEIDVKDAAATPSMVERFQSVEEAGIDLDFAEQLIDSFKEIEVKQILHAPCGLNCYTKPGVQCGCKCHKKGVE